MTGVEFDVRSARTAHRSGRRRWAAILLAVGMVITASAGIATSHVTSAYSAAIRLLGTTIGVGPSFDGFGLSIPLFFYGSAVAQGESFHSVPYPGQLNLNYPFVSALPLLSELPYWPQSLKRSEGLGAGFLLQDIAGTPAGDANNVTIIGMSQGTQVAEIARTEMAKDPKYVSNADAYKFVLIGDPYQPNGGILARFTKWADRPVLGALIPFGRPGASDSPFATTYYQNQYDGLTDFPAYFNLLAVANAVAGIAFEHILPGYVLESSDSPNAVSATVGNTTYVTIPQLLPLLKPLRLAASVVGAQRLVDALDPVLRVFVEMGYDRVADPSQVKLFSWTTPREKVREALNQLPGAFKQSLAILGGTTFTPTVPQPVVSDTEPPTPATVHPVRPVDMSSEAQAARRVVLKLSQVGSHITQRVAQLLRTVGSHASPSTETTEPVTRQRSTRVSPEPLNVPAAQQASANDDAPVAEDPSATSDGTNAAPPTSTTDRSPGARSGSRHHASVGSGRTKRSGSASQSDTRRHGLRVPARTVTSR